VSGTRADRLRRLAGAVIAVALVAATLFLARPGRVGNLLISVDPRMMLCALGASGASLAFRSLRLSLLLAPGSLNPFKAIPITAAAQGAAVFVPARLGELALPWLLKREIALDGASGVATLLTARVLDTAALGAWAGLAVLFLWGLDQPLALGAALILLLPLLLLPVIVTAADRWALDREESWPTGRRVWADRLHRIRTGLDEARRRPLRLAAAAAASMGSWAFQWTLAWCLLVAMGYRWPVWEVVTGSAIASMSNLLPFNLIGNLGTLEAGWTAAFSAMGIKLEIAAATGLACHLWALVFVALFGAIGWMALRLKPSTST